MRQCAVGGDESARRFATEVFVITVLFLGALAIVALIFFMVYILGGDNKSSSSAAAETKSAEDRGEM